jgi:hypothetical protein
LIDRNNIAFDIAITFACRSRDEFFSPLPAVAANSFDCLKDRTPLALEASLGNSVMRK